MRKRNYNSRCHLFLANKIKKNVVLVRTKKNTYTKNQSLIFISGIKKFANSDREFTAFKFEFDQEIDF